MQARELHTRHISSDGVAEEEFCKSVIRINDLPGH